MAYQRKAGNKITFWRVNYNPDEFSDDEREKFIKDKIIVINEIQLDIFSSMFIGDYFYLYYSTKDITSNSIIMLIGKITDYAPEPCKTKVGYWQRHYEIVLPTDKKPVNKEFTIIGRSYLPYKRDSLREIRMKDSYSFQEDILRPYFGVNIENLNGLWSDKVISTTTLRIFPFNQIFHGVPGTGKTYSTTSYAVAICNNKNLDELGNYDKIKREYDKLKAYGRINFITFHQSYGYEDFIEGIKPTIANGNISYEIASGIFKKFCDNARIRPNENFVFIIDEINRGNISKIFGELITLIEDDKREELSVILPYSQDEFTVPKNVYIMGNGINLTKEGKNSMIVPKGLL